MKAWNILFLCTGNSCRSILAEATFNHLAPKNWSAVSAGSKPAGYVHPRSLVLLMKAYRVLRKRIEAFLALPLDTLVKNPAKLQAELERMVIQ